MTERPDALVDAVESVLDRLGLHLYDLELVGRAPSRVLRVTIDRDGGVDLDAITATLNGTSASSTITLAHDATRRREWSNHYGLCGRVQFAVRRFGRVH